MSQTAKASSPSHAPTGRVGPVAAIVMLVVVAASYVVNAMDRQVFPVVLPNIRSDLGFSLAQGGLLATIFTLGIGMAGVPSGYLLDRISRKTVMLIGILLYSAFTILTAHALGFADMFGYRALSGVGEAMQNAALFSAVGAYFFANRALAVGSLNFAYGLGGFIGPLLGSHLATSTGAWQAPFYLFGAIGLAFVVVIAVVVKRKFTEQVDVPVSAAGSRDFDHVPANLFNRNMLLLGVAAVVVGVAMYGYIGLYPTFLREQLGFSTGQAGFAASMFGLGALLGIPAGWIGDRFNQRNIMIGSLLVGCVVGWLLFNGPTSVGLQDLLSFAEGAVASGFLFVNIYSAMQRAARPHMIGRASGLYVASFYVPAAVAGYLFSELVGRVGWGGAALWQLTVLPVVAIVALLFVDTRRFNNATPARSAAPVEPA